MKLSEQLAEVIAATKKNVPADKLSIMLGSTKKIQEQELSAKALKKGGVLLPFKMLDVHGNKKALKDFESDYLVVSFYRGGWCPYCNLELKALQGIVPELEQLNAELIAISPETPDNSLTTYEKNNLSFTVLSDIDNAYAKSLNLVFQMPEDLRELYHSFNLHVDAHNGNKNYELPMPATYVVNKQREVIFSFVPEDYTERLEPNTILDVIKK